MNEVQKASSTELSSSNTDPDMHNPNITSTVYYTVVAITSLMMLYLLTSLLDWPLMAEIPLAASIFIQIMALSRRIFNSWNLENRCDMSDVMFKIKSMLFESQATDK